jgi:hypothetical protein
MANVINRIIFIFASHGYGGGRVVNKMGVFDKLTYRYNNWRRENGIRRKTMVL